MKSDTIITVIVLIMVFFTLLAASQFKEQVNNIKDYLFNLPQKIYPSNGTVGIIIIISIIAIAFYWFSTRD